MTMSTGKLAGAATSLLALCGCGTWSPFADPAPIRISQFTPSTFCRQMTVVDDQGVKQCRASYVKEDTPHTANQIEDICTRWKAAGCAGKGK